MAANKYGQGKARQSECGSNNHVVLKSCIHKTMLLVTTNKNKNTCIIEKSGTFKTKLEAHLSLHRSPDVKS
jgi:hypothetical protein